MIREQRHACLLLISTLVFASGTGLASEAMQSHTQKTSLLSTVLATLKSSGVASVSLGPAWENAGDTQIFDLAPNTLKTYAAHNLWHALGDGALFLGFKKPLRMLESQIGFVIATTGNAKLSGAIWDDAQAQFDNYTYTYSVKHTALAVKGELLVDLGHAIQPWVSGSVGIGFNQSHNFTNTPTIEEAVAMPNFTNNTTTTFTYTVGVGVERNLTPHWQAGLGYEFSDWGKSKLGRAPGQTLNSGLALSHLYTNGFLCNLTYLA